MTGFEQAAPERAARGGRREPLHRRVAGRLADVIALTRRVVIMDEGLILAALALVTVVPVALVVDAVWRPGSVRSFAEWIVRAFALRGSAADTVGRLFPTASQVAAKATALGILTVIVSALAFAAALQRSYERAWHVERRPWRTSVWRHPLWLALATAYTVGLAGASGVTHHGTLGAAAYDVIALLASIVFFAVSQRLLLATAVPARDLLLGAVATSLGLLGLGGLTTILFTPFLVSTQPQYGPAGVVFVLTSWLIGAGVVLAGGPTVASALIDHRSARKVPAADDQGVLAARKAGR